MPRRARRLTLPLAALVLTVVVACTAGPSTRPAVIENDGPPPPSPTGTDTGPAPLPRLQEPLDTIEDWEDCGAETRGRLGGTDTGGLSLQCTRISTTLDAPGLPRRGVLRLALLKAGNGPIPLVVVNDVGGEPGTVYAARLAASLPPELLEKFSLIGMDRRGTGASDAVRCVPGDVRATLLGHDPELGIRPVLDAARSAGQQCAIGLEEERGAFDTWRTAGDLEELRRELGVSHLHAIGHGEGSRVLTAYATRFPSHVGRMVLDGVPDPADDRSRVLDGVAQGAEATLDAFAEDCAARGCPLGKDAHAAVTSLAEAARTRPLRTREGFTMGPALTLRAVLAGLAQRDRWPALADAVAAARKGNAEPLAAFVAPQLVQTEDSAARLDGTIATTCNDNATRLPADRLKQVVKEFGTKYPVFGALIAQELVWCAPWPARQVPQPDPGGSIPPLVVVSTATDPVTPEKGTIRAAEQLPTAVRVAWQGAGHGALRHSRCAADAARAFLSEGKVPRDGTLCPA